MNDRYSQTQSASVLGIIGNIFLLVIKALIGFFSNSQAMIADSINSAGDVFSSLMTFIGNKIAKIPRDDSHNLGHGKAEYIFSMLISISMILVSLKVLINSVKSLIHNDNYRFSWLLVIVCVVPIVVKLCLYLYTHSISKKQNNLLIEANAKDHINDCFLNNWYIVSNYYGIFWYIVV